MDASLDELRTWLDIAEKAARRAGEFLVQARVPEAIITVEFDKDVKLEVDRGSEELIIHMLRERSNFSILSEEGGMIEGKDIHQGLRWVVDPLDGSFNFLRGIPLCCVSVALWRGPEPILGAVYDFNHGEMFTGIAGQGAWLNRLPICVSNTAWRDQAILCTGFPVGTDFSQEALSSYVEQVRVYKKVRLFGSAALSLCYVAAGRVDVYFERDIAIWDVAAGLAIVCGAGGQILQVPSKKPQALTVYAGNSLLPRQSR